MQQQFWTPIEEPPSFSSSSLRHVARRARDVVCVIQRTSQAGRLEFGVGFGGKIVSHTEGTIHNSSDLSSKEKKVYPLIAVLPPMFPEWLGDRSFCEEMSIRFPYLSGAMANGIATTSLVRAMAENGFMGFFGAAGLSIQKVEEAIDELSSTLGDLPWGSNLIHSPNEPELEERIAELYVNRDVRYVSAAAYMKLTLPVVHYALSGLYTDLHGRIQRKNRLFAKISRPEVALHFMSPAPDSMIQILLQQGKITQQQALLARRVPVAECFTVEADSGGHTDNQALTALFPTIQKVRNEISQKYNYQRPIYLGVAGGIGAPQSAAAAFALGAAYVVTGSINQACIESGLHETGRKMLTQAGLADVVMAPAADMFELGVEVQVLKRGTMFGNRAKKLYELYKNYQSLTDIPAKERKNLEDSFFKETIEQAWSRTEGYWRTRDIREVERALSDSKHQMALLFRSYLGQSSKWAIHGVPERRMDYQIWCGPAMGTCNDWLKGSFLQDHTKRTAPQVALNIMEGAMSIQRAQQLRSFGLAIPETAFYFAPRHLEV
jgi:trans-AT polyketide synthase, acyltransferase and oxidoreductase domains